MKSDPEELLFQLAVMKPVNEREAFLDRECHNDAALRARVAALLDAHEQTDDFLENEPAIARETIKLQMPGAADEAVGQKIGRYKILERVGEGGWGVVYIAEQTEPVRRRVALKVIKLGMDTKAVVARFEAERQALAMMDHPNIAKVFDAGSTETGRPYFVMELVRGIRITDYCDQNNLSTKERLELFIKICQAIQHAHQKGVIHRDIKPSNVLVTLHDGVPIPKVIDFGIAKATEGRLTDSTVYTQLHQFIGTPAYTSPEQAEMTGLDVDTRSDIYSLGVMLYELLTGKTPFDANELISQGLDAMRKTIREKEPARPSTKVATLPGKELTSTARRRSTDTSKLVHQLKGDLDWIVMKCLEKDRTRRYETANGLVSDVKRHLEDEPITARPPSRIYRIRKAARRNKLAFAATAVTMLALFGGIISSHIQAVRATRAEKIALRERDAATRAEEHAEQINRFLTEDVLAQATAANNASTNMQHIMLELLDRAANKLDHDINILGHDELEATLRLALGETYRDLGWRPQAEAQIRRAVALRRNSKVLGPGHRETLLAQKDLCCLLVLYMSRWDDATEKLIIETAQGLKSLIDAERGPVFNTNLFRAKFDADAAYCFLLASRGRLEEATRLKLQNVANCEHYFGILDHDSMTALQDLAVIYEGVGDFVHAQKTFEEALRRFEQTRTANTFDGINVRFNLAWSHFLLGDSVAAEALLRDALARAQIVYSPDFPLTLDIQNRLARVLADQRRWQAAEDFAQKTLAARLLVLDTNSGATAYSKVVLARLLIERNQLDQAEPLLIQARATFRQESYSDQPRLAAAAENWLGALYLARTNYTNAAAQLLPLADQFLRPTIEMSPGERRICIGHIIALYRALNKTDQALQWEARLAAIEGPPTKTAQKD